MGRCARSRLRRFRHVLQCGDLVMPPRAEAGRRLRVLSTVR
ncbi:hypothetical protein HMPREF0724_12211 [Prescottella equi ATCC 33707]|uniref:Uncharacterized protein n=1 Tax=Prescottella equi ATCC 33707 TaxID=525370 RepID=E9T0Q2_RHOHA|nr:hypothetical protein HMPREF0724_12211 [Prescottella equi ATCC 33707]